MQTWYGLYVTSETPRVTVDRLAAELTRALKLPEVQARIKGLGGEINNLPVEQFAGLNRSEYERYGKLVRDAGVKAE